MKENKIMNLNIDNSAVNHDNKKLFMPKHLKNKNSTNLYIYTPTMEDRAEYTPIANHNGEVLYHSKPFYDNELKSCLEYDPDFYSNFTFVLNRDGTLWYDANLYLLHLIEQDDAYLEEQRVPKVTIAGHAEALQKYKLFCDERDDENGLSKDQRERMPFWRVAKRPFSRPNIKYRDYLQLRINKGELQGSYVKKLLYPITAFYNFINEKFGKDYLNLGRGVMMPGTVVLVPVDTGNGTGKIVDSNEANRVRGSKKQNLGYIKDGGNTKPLTHEQQIKLFDIIYAKGQPEIIVSHIFAIESAARMDTTFTLRLRHFMNSFPENYSLTGLAKWRKKHEPYDANEVYKIRVGVSTLIDAKGLDKQYVLKVPGWVMEMVRTYAVSKRAVGRRKQIKFPQENSLDEYVFITSSFNPYYVAKSDPNKGYYSNLLNGGSIRTYNTNNIKKNIDFEYKFHFLRATCLMNLVIGLRERKDLTESKILDIVSDFAGHTDVKTTRGYLDYSENEKNRYQAYDIRGDKLMSWISDHGLVKISDDGMECNVYGGWE
jgi:hypothetical protein